MLFRISEPSSILDEVCVFSVFPISDILTKIFLMMWSCKRQRFYLEGLTAEAVGKQIYAR